MRPAWPVALLKAHLTPQATLFIVREEHSLPKESDHNVFFQAKGADMLIEQSPGVEDYTEWRGRGFDSHSVVADPLFVDPDHDDYALKPDSPALKLGFKPIDLSAVGLRGSKWDRRG